MGKNFNNSTDLDNPESGTIYLNALFYTFIISVSVVVTLGNLAVILAMVVHKSLRTPPHLYLGSLALIDFSVGVFILPLRLHQVMNNGLWDFGETMCGIYVTADVTLCTLSIYHLIAIAMDRYRAITQGVKYVQTRSFTMVATTIVFLWVISLWVSTPPFLGWHDDDWGLKVDQENNNKPICVYTQNRGYVFHSALGTFILPTIIIIVLYYRIFAGIQAKLRKRALPVSMGQHFDSNKSAGETSDTFSSEDILEQNCVNLKNESETTLNKRIKFQFTRIRRSIFPTPAEVPTSSNSLEMVQTSETTTTEGLNDHSNSAKINTKSILRKQKSNPQDKRPLSQVEEFVRKKIKFSLTKERRASKMLGVIIGSFLFCWAPFFTMYLIDAFFYPLSHSVWFEVSSWMGYVNSGINPFIYNFKDKDFRRAFSKMIFFWRK
ncbi:tyramine/octopamine receptor-like [Folsomia candida]|uniref:tyramine/octopamine receptor-like n=1 Tax=Folsomia candida TaxID=158441 RepID=UPI001604FF5F|nr:tyramine/octopamine receptor-like [Folsomia candida]